MDPEANTFEENLQKHVHVRLRYRFFVYLIISILMVCIVVFRILKDDISPVFPFIGFVGGAVIGVLVTRVHKISWDRGSRQVITRLDAYGTFILVIYFIFEFFRERVVGYFIHGPVVVVTSFAVLAGIMIGRVVGIRGKIMLTLEENL